MAVATVQSQPTRSLGGSTAIVLSRHLAAYPLPNQTSEHREDALGQADPETFARRIVRILLNHRNMCYINSFIISLAWVTLLMQGIDLEQWPMGGFELFRTLTAVSGLPLNLAVFRPFLWLLSGDNEPGWTMTDLEQQNDVTEFGHWFLWRTKPGFVNCRWVSQLLRMGHIEEQNGTERGDQHGPILIPIHDPQLSSCTLQTLIDFWHDGLGVCRAAQQVGSAIMLNISRFLPETGIKNQQRITISNTVRFPSFLNDNGDTHFHQYHVSALVYHIGANPISGHYRAALQCGQTWFVYEDGKLPDQLNTLTESIERNIVLIWLTPVDAASDRTERPGHEPANINMSEPAEVD